MVFLASSAGGLYAGSTPAPFDERTAPRPLVAYGRAKLAMEAAVSELAGATGVRAVLGRLANVYGPGQTLGKPQGLLSQLCLADATGRPLPVFVSMDTIRDYLYAGDAARMIVRSVALARAEPAGTVVAKVLASGRPVTVGYLVSEARRVFHRPLRTIPVGGASTGQVLDLRLESRVWPEVDALAATPLAAGLSRTSADVRARVVVRRSARRLNREGGARDASVDPGRREEDRRPERQVAPGQHRPVDPGEPGQHAVEQPREAGGGTRCRRRRRRAGERPCGPSAPRRTSGRPWRSRRSPAAP